MACRSWLRVTEEVEQATAESGVTGGLRASTRGTQARSYSSAKSSWGCSRTSPGGSRSSCQRHRRQGAARCWRYSPAPRGSSFPSSTAVSRSAADSVCCSSRSGMSLSALARQRSRPLGRLATDLRDGWLHVRVDFVRRMILVRQAASLLCCVNWLHADAICGIGASDSVLWARSCLGDATATGGSLSLARERDGRARRSAPSDPAASSGTTGLRRRPECAYMDSA